MRVLCIASISVMWLLFSCDEKAPIKSEDYFYNDVGGLDFKRIPLIKPYEVKKITEREWRVDLQTTQLLELSIHNVKDVNVIDSVIVIYAKGEVSIRGITHHEGWFVIIPSREIEMGFSNEKDFFFHLEKERIKFSKFYNVDEVYRIFNASKKINWKNLSITK